MKSERPSLPTASNPARRTAIENIAKASAVLGGAFALPEGWIQPVIKQVILPAHAMTSDGRQYSTIPGAATAVTLSAGISMLYITASGASGGRGGNGTDGPIFGDGINQGGSGGLGATIQRIGLSVSPGDVVQAFVGGQGGDGDGATGSIVPAPGSGGSGGVNTGGGGGNTGSYGGVASGNGGGGGGASIVTVNGTVVAIAAGGGGGGGAGSHGGRNANEGGIADDFGGKGGDSNQNGGASNSGTSGGSASGAANRNGDAGDDSQYLSNPMLAEADVGAGGGGGGGLLGGGGGGSGTTSSAVGTGGHGGGGGGGGSSLVPAGGSVSNGNHSGNGDVLIEWV